VTNLSDHDPGSLRDAIATTPPGGTVTFQPGLAGTITLTTGELAITKNLTIAGPGAGALTVSGNHASRVLDIAATVTISGLTIADGMSSDVGGGIYNVGALTIVSSSISGNVAGHRGGHGGGGIYNAGGLTVTSSDFRDNSTVSGGGGGIDNVGTLSVSSSIFSGNSDFNVGGGIYNTGTLTISSSIFSANMDGGAAGGGGICNEVGTATITNSTISGNTAIFNGGGILNFGGPMTISNSTISGNTAGSFGGGIAINTLGSMLTITNCTISGNTSGEEAGGIAADGPVIINYSTISGNSSRYGGGGIRVGDRLTLTNCTLSGNSTGEFGGGAIRNLGVTSITNSTITGNSASSAGGGLYNDNYSASTLSITSSTISANTAGTGGGLFTDQRPVSVTNTLVARNGASSSPDVSGTLTSQGHNLIGIGDGGSGFLSTDLVGTTANPIDPKLGPLQNNGGPTQTMALLPGSPAIDAGDNAFTPGPYDQRGPGFPRIIHGVIDIGAFEVQAVALTVQCSVTTPVLAPPNHQLVNVGLSVQVSDPNATISVQVFANDDALPADAAGFAPGTLQLRDERQGGGGGRVYLIVVTATDAAGDVAVSVCTVVVPHDHGADALAAVEQQAADAEAYFLAFHTAPPGYRPLG
jgi:hypothetical protein